jgi:hypothetical protein
MLKQVLKFRSVWGAYLLPWNTVLHRRAFIRNANSTEIRHVRQVTPLRPGRGDTPVPATPTATRLVAWLTPAVPRALAPGTAGSLARAAASLPSSSRRLSARPGAQRDPRVCESSTLGRCRPAALETAGRALLRTGVGLSQAVTQRPEEVRWCPLVAPGPVPKANLRVPDSRRAFSSPWSRTGRTRGSPEVSGSGGPKHNQVRRRPEQVFKRTPKARGGGPDSHHLATSKWRRTASACSSLSPSVSLLSLWPYPFKRVMDSFFSLSTSWPTSNQI